MKVYTTNKLSSDTIDEFTYSTRPCSPYELFQVSTPEEWLQLLSKIPIGDEFVILDDNFTIDDFDELEDHLCTMEPTPHICIDQYICSQYGTHGLFGTVIALLMYRNYTLPNFSFSVNLDWYSTLFEGWGTIKCNGKRWKYCKKEPNIVCGTDRSGLDIDRIGEDMPITLGQTSQNYRAFSELEQMRRCLSVNFGWFYPKSIYMSYVNNIFPRDTNVIRIGVHLRSINHFRFIEKDDTVQAIYNERYKYSKITVSVDGVMNLTDHSGNITTIQTDTYPTVDKYLNDICEKVHEISSNKKVVIFIATHVQPFVDMMRHKLPYNIITNDITRQQDIHRDWVDDRVSNTCETALLDSIGLSMCDYIIGGVSNVVWYALCLNNKAQLVVPECLQDVDSY